MENIQGICYITADKVEDIYELFFPKQGGNVFRNLLIDNGELRILCSSPLSKGFNE